MDNLLLNFKVKHYIARIVSLFLLGHGLYKLGGSLLETFTLAQTVQTATNIPHEEFQLVLKEFLVETIEAIVETVWGVVLLFTHSHKLKFMHIIIGIAIALLPWIINDRILRQVETQIPKVQLLAPLAFAQDTTPQQALSDYEFQLQKYREAHQEYLQTKNLYLSFQTLNSKAAAIEATKTLLISRAEVLRTYLFALRVTLPPSSNFATKLAAEEKYLTDYQKDISQITDLTVLTQTSQLLESKYPSLQVLGYQSLHAILTHEQQALTQTLKQYHQNLQTLVTGAQDTEINKPQANQWLSDINQAFISNQESFTDSEQQLLKLKPKDLSILTNQRDFAKTLNTLDLTKNRLLQIVNYLRETINLLKYG